MPSLPPLTDMCVSRLLPSLPVESSRVERDKPMDGQAGGGGVGCGKWIHPPSHYYNNLIRDMEITGELLKGARWPDEGPRGAHVCVERET